MAGTKTEIVALRPFPYSNNGVLVEYADLGDIIAINSDLVPGLVAEKFAKVFDGRSLPAKPEAEIIAAAQEAEQLAVAPPSPDRVEIPADWQAMHHMRLIALAQRIEPAVKTKADAFAAIEAELARQAA